MNSIASINITVTMALPLHLLYVLRLSIVLLSLPLLGIAAASPLPPESQPEFTLRILARRGLTDRLHGVPTPKLDILAALRVVNPADEERCFRRGSATVKHESTSTVLAKGVVPEFCVAAESAMDADMWAHGDRKAWPQEARDGVIAELLRGELRLQVDLELVDDAGTVEVEVACTLNQDYSASDCQPRISSPSTN